MLRKQNRQVIEEYNRFIGQRLFPCIGAKAAIARKQVHCMVAGSMACPADDAAILKFLYDFTDSCRKTGGLFHSAAILFNGPGEMSEEIFETLLWQRLQSISNLDAANYRYDSRVSSDTSSPDFAFSLKEEAFFIIGMHPYSSRASRQLAYPALVFNPHAQFEEMKETNKYEMMKKAVRKMDIIFSGSVNPMLDDFGKSPEIRQYSGKNYSSPLQCPLKINHANK